MMLLEDLGHHACNPMILCLVNLALTQDSFFSMLLPKSQSNTGRERMCFIGIRQSLGAAGREGMSPHYIPLLLPLLF